MIDILIPTCKTREEIVPLICEMEGYSEGCNVYATCLKESASVNRNKALDATAGDVVVMVDDDIAGFYPGWWKDLTEPLKDDSVMIVSARLMNPDGSKGLMMYDGDIKKDGCTEVPRVPTAAIAFKRSNIRFYEGYILSGFEDDHFCAEMQEVFGKKVVINNKCKLIHINEQKGQKAGWEHNKKLFDSIWETSKDGTKRTRQSGYYSEYGEDKWVNDNIFKGKRSGVFFECGAIDGIVCSNTLFFERALGWTGLCVEPNPVEFAKLKKNRTCKVDNLAIYDKPGSAEFLAIDGGLVGWGGIVASIELQHAERIQKQIPAGEQYKITVPCVTLEDMLKKHGLKKVDFLSLDIEGAEFKVLKDFPFKEFDIEVFAIENNFGTYPIELLMNNNGYDKVAEIKITEIYKKKKPVVIDQSKNIDGYWGIPKILHFVWLGTMPSWVQANIDEFKRLNPEFEVKIHGEEGLDPVFNEQYKRINHPQHSLAMKSDLIRVSQLLKDGGWYWDCDFWPLISIKEMCAQMDLRSGMPLFARWDNDCAANGVMACFPRDEFIKTIAEGILSKKGTPQWYDYGTWVTSWMVKNFPELVSRQEFSRVLPCYHSDSKIYKENVMKIMDSKEKIDEVKSIGGWAIHYGMTSTIDVGDIYPIRKVKS